MSDFGWLLIANGACLFASIDSLKRFERYMIKYAQFSYFEKTASKFNKIVLLLFCERKGKYSKFVFYSFIYETALALMQVPLLAWAYFSKAYLNSAFFVIYLVSLLVLGFGPAVATNIFRFVYYFRSVKIERKTTESKDKNTIYKGLKYKKILQKKTAIYDAIDKYITIPNPKKNKRYIAPESIEKVKLLIANKFPYAHTKEEIDIHGVKMFEVYFKHKKDVISVICVPVFSKNEK